ncbi:protein ripply3 isoform 1-T1 [Guaruba guarouba]
MEGAAASLSLQAAVQCVCHRSQGTQQQDPPPPPREHPESPALWRPWTLTARDGEMTENQQMSELDGQLANFRSKGALGFQHPVRYLRSCTAILICAMPQTNLVTAEFLKPSLRITGTWRGMLKEPTPSPVEMAVTTQSPHSTGLPNTQQ